MMIKQLSLFLFSSLALTVSAVHNIMDCPTLTVGNSTTSDQEYANAQCWMDTIVAANASDSKVAWIPGDIVVNMMPIEVHNLNDMVLRIDGVVLASHHWSVWPVKNYGNGPNGEGGDWPDFWYF